MGAGSRARTASHFSPRRKVAKRRSPRWRPFGLRLSRLAAGGGRPTGHPCGPPVGPAPSATAALGAIKADEERAPAAGSRRVGRAKRSPPSSGNGNYRSSPTCRGLPTSQPIAPTRKADRRGRSPKRGEPATSRRSLPSAATQRTGHFPTGRPEAPTERPRPQADIGEMRNASHHRQQNTERRRSSAFYSPSACHCLMLFQFMRDASRILHASLSMKSYQPKDRLASAAPQAILLAASVQTRSIWS